MANKKKNSGYRDVRIANEHRPSNCCPRCRPPASAKSGPPHCNNGSANPCRPTSFIWHSPAPSAHGQARNCGHLHTCRRDAMAYKPRNISGNIRTPHHPMMSHEQSRSLRSKRSDNHPHRRYKPPVYTKGTPPETPDIDNGRSSEMRTCDVKRQEHNETKRGGTCKRSLMATSAADNLLASPTTK